MDINSNINTALEVCKDWYDLKGEVPDEVLLIRAKRAGISITHLVFAFKHKYGYLPQY